MGHELPAPFSSEAIAAGLRWCKEAYADETPPGLIRWIRFRPYRLTHWFGFIKEDSEVAHPRRVYVAFRGTDPDQLGTWIITNGQAASREVQDQGCIHQGFFRAWSWLWRNADPLGGFESWLEAVISPLAAIASTPRPYVVIIVLVTGITGVALALLEVAGWTWIAPAAGIITALFCGSIQSGLLERLSWLSATPEQGPILGVASKPKSEGLAAKLQTLDGFNELWFVGHSLGGAMATLAFNEYRRNGPARKDRSFLLTFGAPRIGDETFVNSFKREHAGFYLHVIDQCDPVPCVPPRSSRDLWKLRERLQERSYGAILVIASALWYGFATLWKQSPYSTWPEGKLLLGKASEPLQFSRHGCRSYDQVLKDEGVIQG